MSSDPGTRTLPVPRYDSAPKPVQILQENSSKGPSAITKQVGGQRHV
jgi:hypothetical protein